MKDDDVGFYRLSQLCSRQETEKTKAYVGVFPWGRTKILEMVEAGEFPAPIKNYGKILIWPKEAIHKYIKKIKENGEEKRCATNLNARRI